MQSKLDANVRQVSPEKLEAMEEDVEKVSFHFTFPCMEGCKDFSTSDKILRVWIGGYLWISVFGDSWCFWVFDRIISLFCEGMLL